MPHRFRSAREAAGIEKGLFLGSSDAAEHRIAMRESSEPADDVGMKLRPFQRIRVAACARERDAALLVRKILGVLKGQIKEAALFSRNVAVEAARKGPVGDGASRWIGGEGARVAAEHVA